MTEFRPEFVCDEIGTKLFSSLKSLFSSQKCHFCVLFVTLGGIFFPDAELRATFADMETKLSLRLDNASNIYPASLTKRYASIYRLSVTLSESVNVNILQQALVNTIKRIPTFGCTLKNGFFWWYLSTLEKMPVVSKYTGIGVRGFRFHGGFLFKVMVDGNRIILDVFHAIADGHGGQTFLLTLAGEYIRMRYKTGISYDSLVLDPNDTPKSCETDDSFRNFSGKKGSLEQDETAYHISGKKICCQALKGERMEISAADIKAAVAQSGYTVTDFLAAAMLDALQQEHRHNRKRHKRNNLKINVPVDLRRLFEGRTLRNYSSYVNLGVDVSNGYYSFDELIQIVAAQKALKTLPSELEKKIAANVALEDNMAISIIPRCIKRFAIDTICRLKGDKLSSYTISNLGNVVLPEQMRPYITSMDFVLGRQRGTSGAASAVGYNGKIVLWMTRNIVENKFEHFFAEILREHGIAVDVVSEEIGTSLS